MNQMYMDVKWLRANHTMVHYFGLGFIQLKINAVERMHFYIPGIEPITPEEDVHNHRYDFTSTIMKGGLVQQLYSVEPSCTGEYELEDVTCEEGVLPERILGTFLLTHDSTHCYRKESSYTISHGQFHRITSMDEGCITLLRRGGYMKDRAQVARPIGGLTVCPFSKKIPEDELWRLVGEALS